MLSAVMLLSIVLVTALTVTCFIPRNEASGVTTCSFTLGSMTLLSWLFTPFIRMKEYPETPSSPGYNSWISFFGSISNNGLSCIKPRLDIVVLDDPELVSPANRFIFFMILS